MHEGKVSVKRSLSHTLRYRLKQKQLLCECVVSFFPFYLFLPTSFSILIKRERGGATESAWFRKSLRLCVCVSISCMRCHNGCMEKRLRACVRVCAPTDCAWSQPRFAVVGPARQKKSPESLQPGPLWFLCGIPTSCYLLAVFPQRLASLPLLAIHQTGACWHPAGWNPPLTRMLHL